MDDRYKDYEEFDNYSESPDDMLEGTRPKPLQAWIDNEPNYQKRDKNNEQVKSRQRGDNTSASRPDDDWVMISRWEDI